MTSTAVNYGLTTAYGTTVTGQPDTQSQFSNAYNGNLNGLTANTTYHFLITATDAQGHSLNSGDMTFTTTAP